MAKKPAKKVQPETDQSNTFDIVSDERKVTFNLHLNGTESGKLESTICKLHRMMLSAQHEAYTVRKDEDYIPYYARNLSDRFNTFVSEPAAYKIACITAELFAEQKKS
jgi:hypothetical protein